MVATILGEAGNQGSAGQNAVASVIRNRAVNGSFGGDTPQGVVTAPNQFEPWNTTAGRSRMAMAAADPKQAAAADAAISQAYGEGGTAPNDPTNGATMFFSPTAQAALGRSVPSWAQGSGQDIGDHRFFGGVPQAPTQVAQAVPATDDSASTDTALPANSQPAQFVVPGAQATAQPQNRFLFKNASDEDLQRALINPFTPENVRTALTQEYKMRADAAQKAADPMRHEQLIKAQRDNQLSSDPYHDADGNLVQKDALGKVTVLSAADKTPNSVGEYKFYADQEKAGGRTPLPYGQWDTARKRAGAINVDTGAIPQGYQLITDPATGAKSLQPLAGGPKDTSKKDQAAAENRETLTDVVTNAAKLARGAISDSTLPATGTASSVLSNFGESGAAGLRRQIGVLKANASIEALNAMRQQSPTGGALGSVTEKEEALLAAKAGALDPTAPRHEVEKALDDYERTLLRTVHGRAAGDSIYEKAHPTQSSASSVLRQKYGLE
jgi:hypothetical protein